MTTETYLNNSLPKRDLLLLFAPNGGGKGLLSSNMRKLAPDAVHHVSPGDAMRAQPDDKKYGIFHAALQREQEKMRKGELVDDGLMNSLAKLLIGRELMNKETKVVIADGFPRTPNQFDYLNDVILPEYRQFLDVRRLAVYLDVPLEEILGRIEKRRTDMNSNGTPRPDDTKEIAMKRYDSFMRQTYDPLVKPLIDEGEVKVIDGKDRPEIVLFQVAKIVFPDVVNRIDNLTPQMKPTVAIPVS